MVLQHHVSAAEQLLSTFAPPKDSRRGSLQRDVLAFFSCCGCSKATISSKTIAALIGQLPAVYSPATVSAYIKKIRRAFVWHKGAAVLLKQYQEASERRHADANDTAVATRSIALLFG